MRVWLLPITFLTGALAGGWIGWAWRGRSGGPTRRQRLQLVAATVLATLLLVAVGGYAVVRYRFGETEVSRASTGQAVADFRKRGGAARSAAGTPPPGVYTYRAEGGMQVDSALFGKSKRTLPATIPAVLVHDPKRPRCWELTLRLYAQNHRAERYCKDAAGLRLVGRWERNEMFGIQTHTRQGVTPTLLVGPDPKPGSVRQMTWKILEHKTSMPMPVKRPDLSLRVTYVGTENLRVGDATVRAHHLRQHADYTGSVSGTLDREVWYQVDTGMMLQLHVRSTGKGMASITIDRRYSLTSLTPKR